MREAITREDEHYIETKWYAVIKSNLDEITKKVNEVFEEATLLVSADRFMQTGGKQGIHTEHLGYILAEMQYRHNGILPIDIG